MRDFLGLYWSDRVVCRQQNWRFVLMSLARLNHHSFSLSLIDPCASKVNYYEYFNLWATDLDEEEIPAGVSVIHPNGDQWKRAYQRIFGFRNCGKLFPRQKPASGAHMPYDRYELRFFDPWLPSPTALGRHDDQQGFATRVWRHHRRVR